MIRSSQAPPRGGGFAFRIHGAVGRVPMAIGLCGALLVAGAPDVTAAPAVLRADVVGCVGGIASSGHVRLGFTGGQVASGLSANSRHAEVAGFWGGAFHPVASEVGDEPSAGLPAVTRFHGVHPNPVNQAATFRFDLAPTNLLARAGDGATSAAPVAVRLDLFDVAGRRVSSLLNEELGPGQHQLSWNRAQADRELGPGVYFARLRAGAYERVARVVVR